MDILLYLANPYYSTMWRNSNCTSYAGRPRGQLALSVPVLLFNVEKLQLYELLLFNVEKLQLYELWRRQ